MNTASTRKQAKLLGLVRYSTGKPCPAGHVVERYTSTGGCTQCMAAKASAWKASNPEKHRAGRKAWGDANKDKMRAVKAAWNKANPQGQAKRSREWFLKNRDKANAATKRWVKKNPANALAWATKSRLDKQRRVPSWADHDLIRAIYKLAKVYRQFGHDVHVDHEIPLRGKTVCGLHVHNNLQIIPAEHNRQKSNVFQSL